MRIKHSSEFKSESLHAEPPGLGPLTVGVNFEDRCAGRIEKLCLTADQTETGGILVGRYSPDHTAAIIGRAWGPTTDSTATRSTFYRGIAGLKGRLTRLWKRGAGYYLGEWHFHPRGSGAPSSADDSALRRIASDPRYSCPEPILLIVSRSEEVLVFDVVVYSSSQNPIHLVPTPGVRESLRSFSTPIRSSEG